MASSAWPIRGFPKIRGTFLGVLIINIFLHLGSHTARKNSDQGPGAQALTGLTSRLQQEKRWRQPHTELLCVAKD